MKALSNINLILPDRIIKRATIIFDNNIIEIRRAPIPDYNKVDHIIDGKGNFLSPGFIDIHVHGSGGHDTMEGNRESLKEISQSLVRFGVTGFLPTTMTMSSEEIRTALNSIQAAKNDNLEGARVLGAHMEGPFINPEYSGAQSQDNIKKPDLQLVRDYLDVIKIITMAPEIKGGLEFIKEVDKWGITAGVGHSAATFDQIKQAQSFGLSHAAHMFNAMTGLHHRRPGVVGAVLTSDMTCELIADYVHLRPEILNLVTRTKDPAQIILVSDAMEAGGLGDGQYMLGGQRVYVSEGEARLADDTLAGSVLTLDQAVVNMLNAVELPLYEVINMVSYNPARLLGIDHYLGSLQTGHRADMVLLDKDLNIKQVYVGGEKKYSDLKEG